MKQNENYEKKYKEALERAEKIKQDINNIGCSMNTDMLDIIFPELSESEDEKNANALIGLLNDERVSVLMTYEARQQWLNWLERKKIPSVSFNPALGFDPGSAVVYHNDDSEDKKMIGTIRLALTDVPEERFTTEGTSLSKVFAWIDKQKINTDGDFARGYDCGYKACLNSHGAEFFEKQKEQKPVEFDEYKIIKKHITEDMLSSEVNKRLTECGWYVLEREYYETGTCKRNLRRQPL